MTDIMVQKYFKLNLGADGIREFRPGLHRNVDERVANHWYTKLHACSPEDAVEIEAPKSKVIPNLGTFNTRQNTVPINSLKQQTDPDPNIKSKFPKKGK